MFGCVRPPRARNSVLTSSTRSFDRVNTVLIINSELIGNSVLVRHPVRVSESEMVAAKQLTTGLMINRHYRFACTGIVN